MDPSQGRLDRLGFFVVNVSNLGMLRFSVEAHLSTGDAREKGI